VSTWLGFEGAADGVFMRPRLDKWVLAHLSGVKVQKLPIRAYIKKVLRFLPTYTHFPTSLGYLVITGLLVFSLVGLRHWRWLQVNPSEHRETI